MIYRLKLFLRFLKFIITHPRSLKYLGKWMKYRFSFSSKNFIAAQIPWMNLEVCHWLKAHLKKDMKLFEWGSGGSTLFFSSLVNQVISIEYDEEYFKFVKETFQKEKRENVNLILSPSQEKGNMLSFSPDHVGKYFDSYVNTIDAYPDKHFDVIVVDGRQRNQCFRKALSKMKEDGIIIFDNFDREIYKKSQYYPGLQSRSFTNLMPFESNIGTTTIFSYNINKK